MKAMIENIFREEIRRKVDEYFGSLIELNRGPVFQVHAAMTRNGLTKAVRQTKRSQFADMKKNESVLFKATKGVTIERLHSRLDSTRSSMQKKTGYRWRVNNARDQNGVRVTRTA